MNLRELARAIAEAIKREPYGYTAYEDYYNMACEILRMYRSTGVGMLTWLAERMLLNMVGIMKRDEETGRKIMALHRRVLLAAAPYDLDCYMQFVEWNREPEKKFYMPRRKQLRSVVQAIQDLADDKLDVAAISLPPGVGKSTVAIIALTWFGGRNPDAPILTGSHSNSWVRGAYDECLRIMDKNGEYLWSEVFPRVQVSNTNAKDCRIDLGRRKRFETLQFTSIGTGNAGLYRAMQLLYCDDLVSGIEVAMSKERLDKLWEIYNTDLRQRKIGRCKELHISTRWSRVDVVGRLEEEYGESDRARFIVVPALDENDESNFDYPFGVGFSTQFYHEQREIMEDANWRALYMGEPIERSGLLYPPDELRRYFELPDEEPDAIIAVCDPKDKGTDYCVMPIAYQYGPDFYIESVICDNSSPKVVEPRLASALVEHQVQLARFESNQAGGRVAEKVQEMVKELGGRAKLSTKYTTSNKETKVLVNSPWVIKNCLFKDESVYKGDREYKRFMQFVTGYTLGGKNKYDDTVDALAMLAEYIQSFALNRVEIVKRPF